MAQARRQGRAAMLLAAAAVLLCGGCSGCGWSVHNEQGFHALLGSLLSTRPLVSTCSGDIPPTINTCDAAS